jgi:hypothetical protein
MTSDRQMDSSGGAVIDVKVLPNQETVLPQNLRLPTVILAGGYSSNGILFPGVGEKVQADGTYAQWDFALPLDPTQTYTTLISSLNGEGATTCDLALLYKQADGSDGTTGPVYEGYDISAGTVLDPTQVNLEPGDLPEYGVDDSPLKLRVRTYGLGVDQPNPFYAQIGFVKLLQSQGLIVTVSEVW